MKRRQSPTTSACPAARRPSKGVPSPAPSLATSTRPPPATRCAFAGEVHQRAHAVVAGRALPPDDARRRVDQPQGSLAERRPGATERQQPAVEVQDRPRVLALRRRRPRIRVRRPRQPGVGNRPAVRRPALPRDRRPRPVAAAGIHGAIGGDVRILESQLLARVPERRPAQREQQDHRRARPRSEPNRVRWRDTSWFESTHVGHASIGSWLGATCAMRSRQASTSHGVITAAGSSKTRCSSSWFSRNRAERRWNSRSARRCPRIAPTSRDRRRS